MGFFDPMHSGINMGPEFGRGQPGQQGGFGGMPLNMNAHGGIGMPHFQPQRFLHYDGNQMMGPLSPGLPGLPSGSGIGPPPSSRVMDINMGRLQHYRASQQSQLQHSPVSLSPMPGMNALSPGITSQNPYNMRMPSLGPKQQMIEPRLQSQIGNGISRWPRMPGVASMSRSQMPHLMMQQGIPGSMPMLHSANNFQFGNSQGFSSPDMLRFLKMENDDNFQGSSQPVNSFDFGQSQQFPPNQNPYNLDRVMHQQPPFKQSTGNPLAMSQDHLPMQIGPNGPSQQQQPLSFVPPPNSKQLSDNYAKFGNPVPNSPKLTHFGPSSVNDIFDQPPNSLASQQKSPFSPFGEGLADNLSSTQPMGMRNVHHANLPNPSSSPMMQTNNMNLRSPTKISPLLMQIQQLKQQIAQLEDSPMGQGSPQLSILKQQLEQTYFQYISQQRSNEFPSMKEVQRQPSQHEFLLDKSPMTPRPQPDFSRDKPPISRAPQQMNDFRLEKVAKNTRTFPPNEFLHEKALANAPSNLQQDLIMIKSPQTPGPPSQHDLLLDKPPMTPRPKSHHEFAMEKQQQQQALSQPPNEYLMDRHAHTPRPKLQHGFMFDRPLMPFSQQQHQPNFMFDKLPPPPRPPHNQHDPMIEKALHSPHGPRDLMREKLSSTGVSHATGPPQQNFNMVKSPITTQAPSQLSVLHEQHQAHLALQSPSSIFSQTSQSPISVQISQSISQDQTDSDDMDIKDDISFLDELFKAKLAETSVKQNIDMMSLQPGRKTSVSRVSDSMPVLDGMHSTTPSSSIPPTMPVLAPSVPPISAPMPQFHAPPLGVGPAMPQMSQISQNHMPPMPLPMQMSMMSMQFSNPMMMMGAMQDQGHPMMMHGMFNPNFGQAPLVRPPSRKSSSNKDKAKATKSGSRAARSVFYRVDIFYMFLVSDR